MSFTNIATEKLGSGMQSKEFASWTQMKKDTEECGLSKYRARWWKEGADKENSHKSFGCIEQWRLGEAKVQLEFKVSWRYSVFIVKDIRLFTSTLMCVCVTTGSAGLNCHLFSFVLFPSFLKVNFSQKYLYIQINQKEGKESLLINPTHHVFCVVSGLCVGALK